MEMLWDRSVNVELKAPRAVLGIGPPAVKSARLRLSNIATGAGKQLRTAA